MHNTKLNMNYLQLKKLAAMALVAGALITSVPVAKATLICNNWQSGSASGNQVFQCNLNNGQTGGSYNNSYLCSKPSNTYCLVDYKGGNNYQGACSIVFNCYNGQSYVCDLKNWDGKEQIKCNYNLYNCKDICIYGPKPQGSPGAVPEPATVVAGALLLLPLGVGMMRTLRKNKIQTPV